MSTDICLAARPAAGRIRPAGSTLRHIMTNLPTWLAQLQFFTGLGFLLVFLLIELALAWVLLAFKLAAHRSARPEWVAAYRFWVRVFALARSFSMMVRRKCLVGVVWTSVMEKC